MMSRIEQLAHEVKNSPELRAALEAAKSGNQSSGLGRRTKGKKPYWRIWRGIYAVDAAWR
jgi:hypothetical protein